MGRCYQSWSLRKMEEEKPYSFDMFLEEILAEINKMKRRVRRSPLLTQNPQPLSTKMGC